MFYFAPQKAKEYRNPGSKDLVKLNNSVTVYILFYCDNTVQPSPNFNIPHPNNLINNPDN